MEPDTDSDIGSTTKKSVWGKAPGGAPTIKVPTNFAAKVAAKPQPLQVAPVKETKLETLSNNYLKHTKSNTSNSALDVVANINKKASISNSGEENEPRSSLNFKDSVLNKTRKSVTNTSGAISPQDATTTNKLSETDGIGKKSFALAALGSKPVKGVPTITPGTGGTFTQLRKFGGSTSKPTLQSLTALSKNNVNGSSSDIAEHWNNFAKIKTTETDRKSSSTDSRNGANHQESRKTVYNLNKKDTERNNNQDNESRTTKFGKFGEKFGNKAPPTIQGSIIDNNSIRSRQNRSAFPQKFTGTSSNHSANIIRERPERRPRVPEVVKVRYTFEELLGIAENNAISSERAEMENVTEDLLTVEPLTPELKQSFDITAYYKDWYEEIQNDKVDKNPRRYITGRGNDEDDTKGSFPEDSNHHYSGWNEKESSNRQVKHPAWSNAAQGETGPDDFSIEAGDNSNKYKENKEKLDNSSDEESLQEKMSFFDLKDLSAQSANFAADMKRQRAAAGNESTNEAFSRETETPLCLGEEQLAKDNNQHSTGKQPFSEPKGAKVFNEEGKGEKYLSSPSFLAEPADDPNLDPSLISLLNESLEADVDQPPEETLVNEDEAIDIEKISRSEEEHVSGKRLDYRTFPVNDAASAGSIENEISPEHSERFRKLEQNAFGNRPLETEAPSNSVQNHLNMDALHRSKQANQAVEITNWNLNQYGSDNQFGEFFQARPAVDHFEFPQKDSALSSAQINARLFQNQQLLRERQQQLFNAKNQASSRSEYSSDPIGFNSSTIDSLLIDRGMTDLQSSRVGRAGAAFNNGASASLTQNYVETQNIRRTAGVTPAKKYFVNDEGIQMQHMPVKWFYRDPQGNAQGPFESNEMRYWFLSGFFKEDLMITRHNPNNVYMTLSSYFPRSIQDAFLEAVPNPNVSQQNLVDSTDVRIRAVRAQLLQNQGARGIASGEDSITNLASLRGVNLNQSTFRSSAAVEQALLQRQKQIRSLLESMKLMSAYTLSKLSDEEVYMIYKFKKGESGISEHLRQKIQFYEQQVRAKQHQGNLQPAARTNRPSSRNYAVDYGLQNLTGGQQATSARPFSSTQWGNPQEFDSRNTPLPIGVSGIDSTDGFELNSASKAFFNDRNYLEHNTPAEIERSMLIERLQKQQHLSKDGQDRVVFEIDKKASAINQRENHFLQMTAGSGINKSDQPKKNNDGLSNLNYAPSGGDLLADYRNNMSSSANMHLDDFKWNDQEGSELAKLESFTKLQTPVAPNQEDAEKPFIQRNISSFPEHPNKAQSNQLEGFSIDTGHDIQSSSTVIKGTKEQSGKKDEVILATESGRLDAVGGDSWITKSVPKDLLAVDQSNSSSKINKNEIANKTQEHDNDSFSGTSNLASVASGEISYNNMSLNLKKMLGLNVQPDPSPPSLSQEKKIDAKLQNQTVNPWGQNVASENKNNVSLAQIQAEEKSRIQQKNSLNLPQTTQPKLWATMVAKNTKNEPLYSNPTYNQQMPITSLQNPSANVSNKDNVLGQVASDTAKVRTRKALISWCQLELKKLDKEIEPSLLQFCINSDSGAEIREFFRDTLGSTPEVSQFASEFLKMKMKTLATTSEGNDKVKAPKNGGNEGFTTVGGAKKKKKSVKG